MIYSSLDRNVCVKKTKRKPSHDEQKKNGRYFLRRTRYYNESCCVPALRTNEKRVSRKNVLWIDLLLVYFIKNIYFYKINETCRVYEDTKRLKINKYICMYSSSDEKPCDCQTKPKNRVYTTKKRYLF